MKTRRLFAMLPLVALGLLATFGAADAAKKGRRQVQFIGGHPIAEASGGGFCYIDAPHVHVYEPVKAKVLYRMQDDHYHFVGDPVPYGYVGPQHNYYGHHPVHADLVVQLGEPHPEFCYLEGPHFHDYRPPAEAKFTVEAGAYWYVGELPEVYVDERPALVEINAVYKPLVYERPVVVVAEPPHGYVGVVVGLPVVEVDTHPVEVVPVVPVVEAHGHGHVGAGVHAGIEVSIPVPTLSVEVGVGGGVIVDGHHHHKKHKRDNGRHRGHWKGRGHR